eukprot:COSAG06_NODE_917_length_11555_cov_62.488041_4_plen_74_part_00
MMPNDDITTNAMINCHPQIETRKDMAAAGFTHLRLEHAGTRCLRGLSVPFLAAFPRRGLPPLPRQRSIATRSL